MDKSKKKLIEIKGTKLQKTCLLLQLILLIVALLSAVGLVYININNIDSNIFSIIFNFSVGGIFALLLIPIIIQSNK